jgi:hypothetical protein
MGSRVCSRKSRICGEIIVSSGMLCNVIQAKREAFFMPLRLGVARVSKARFRSGIVFDS